MRSAYVRIRYCCTYDILSYVRLTSRNRNRNRENIKPARKIQDETNDVQIEIEKRQGKEEKCKPFCQRQVDLVTLVPKTGTFQNQAQITRKEPCDWPASHRTCFWLEKVRYTWFCLLCLVFNCFCRFFSQRPYISAPTGIIRRLIVSD